MAGMLGSLAPTEPVVEDAVLEGRLDQLLEAVEAPRDRPVGVAGPGSLDLMCALWRRGFQRVEAVRASTCGCADETCALLLIGGPDVASIIATVDATGGLLCAGGQLGVIAPVLKHEVERRRLLNLLAHRGFRYRAEADGSAVLVATKPEAEDLTALH